MGLTIFSNSADISKSTVLVIKVFIDIGKPASLGKISEANAGNGA